MATLPILLSLADDFDRLTSAAVTPFYYSEWPQRRSMALANRPKMMTPTSHVGKDGFQVSMDVAHFKPSELNVKVVDNSVVVEGKHEEREDDHGYISRHFVRRYTLPKGYDTTKVNSTLSSDGVLTVTAPKPQIEDKSKERVVQIQQTGPAHLNVKENPKEDEKKEEQPNKKK